VIVSITVSSVAPTVPVRVTTARGRPAEVGRLQAALDERVGAVAHYERTNHAVPVAPR